MEDLQDTYSRDSNFKFGESTETCRRLNGFVRKGQKVASCEVWEHYEADLYMMPQVGRCDIITNWHGTSALANRTQKVQTTRLCDVTKAMAQADGVITGFAVGRAIRVFSNEMKVWTQ